MSSKKQKRIWSMVRLLRLDGVDSSARLASGLCLGIAVGLLPKFSLLTWLIATAAILSTANLLTGLVGLAIGIGFASIVDLCGNPLGEKLIHWPTLQPMFAQLLDLPVLAMAHFENSAVTGNLALLLIFGGPVYFLVRQGFDWLRPRLWNYLSSRFLVNLTTEN